MLNTRPIIASTVYRKSIPQRRPIDVYGLMPSYTEAISKAGGIPLLIPLGLSEEDLLAILERVDGLLLPGGGDIDPFIYNDQRHPTVYGVDPERDRTEIFMARAAVTGVSLFWPSAAASRCSMSPWAERCGRMSPARYRAPSIIMLLKTSHAATWPIRLR